MKEVKQEVFVLEFTPNIGELIELAGRNCYKSEEFIGEGSAEKFVTKLLKVYKHDSVSEHGVISVRLITDRGVMGQVTRHRLASYSIESTRYNNYSKGKFNNEITTIRPNSFKYKESHDVWENAMNDAEKHYMKLLDIGEKAESARSVLPTSLKTDIVMTANVRSWRNFFELRMDSHAQPEIIELANLAYNAMLEAGIPAYLFKDIVEQDAKKELKALKEENKELKNQFGKLQQDCIRLSYAESLLAMAREMLDDCHAYDSDVFIEITEFLHGEEEE